MEHRDQNMRADLDREELVVKSKNKTNEQDGQKLSPVV